MALSEDLQKIYDSFSEEDKALYKKMKDVVTSDTTQPSTGTASSTGTGGYGLPKRVVMISLKEQLNRRNTAMTLFEYITEKGI